MAAQLRGQQISALLESLPGIASVLRSPVADAIVGTGVKTTVREFAQAVCDYVGISYSDCVEEKPLQDGRAPDSVIVVADTASPSLYFGGAVKFEVSRLIKLLVRCEKSARRKSCGKDSEL